MSPEFRRNSGSGGQTEGLHFIGVLSFDDEFREDVAWGGGRCLKRFVAQLARQRFGTPPGDGLSHGDPAEGVASTKVLVVNRLRLTISATVFLLRPTSRLIRR